MTRASRTEVRRIEVAGLIASGKTTLVSALAGSGICAVLENHALNPFCDAFFRDPSAHAFETELGFLLQHYHFAKLAQAKASGPTVLDHSFELDFAYAATGLAGTRMRLFEATYHEIRRELGPPSALVFVRCDPKTALARIRNRSRPHEARIPLEFLIALGEAIEGRLAELSEEVPVVHVDAATTDFRTAGPSVHDLRHALGLR